MIRLAKLRKEPFAAIMMSDLRSADFASWRDKRLRDVSPETVRREMQLVSGVMNQAVREWGYLTENPMESVRRPAEHPHAIGCRQLGRWRRWPCWQERICLWLQPGLTMRSCSRSRLVCGLARLSACAGMMSTWRGVSRICRSRKTAAPGMCHCPWRLCGSWKRFPGLIQCFGLNGAQRDALWRKLRDRAGVVGLTFHDARHLAVTRLAKKLDVLDLARMVGHKNIQMLMRYYNASASDIAKGLD